MPNLFTIPNELLDRIAFYLNARSTSRLLISCRSISSRLGPAMLHHAKAPKAGMHPLHWAAERGHLPLLQRILPFFHVDIPGSTGGTPLQVSAWAHNNPLILQHLLLHGADVNYIDDHGFTALHYACQATPAAEVTEVNAEATVRVLLAHGANPNIESPTNGRVPLALAKHASMPNVGRLLLEAGADPNCFGSECTPISFLAVDGRDQEWLALLLDHGADVNGRSKHGNVLLLLAVEFGCLNVVELLVSRGANLGCVTREDDTLLVHALSWKRWDIAEYLVGVDGIDLTSKGHQGSAPFHMAAAMGLDAIIGKLLDKGYPVDDVDGRGRTALHIAVINQRVTVVRTLLSSGAKTDVVYDGKQTPLLCAMQVRNEEIKDMIINGVADPNTGGTGCFEALNVTRQL